MGITGIDLSGKTEFAQALAGHLTSQGYEVCQIHLDDFHNPKKVRYSGENEAENYYLRGFDLRTLIEKMLYPLHLNSAFTVDLELLDLFTDKYEVVKRYSFTRNTIVLFEGVFLFRKELAPYIDYKIFLNISIEEVKVRARLRDVPIYGESILSKYDEKYIPAQEKYLAEFPPENLSDLIIDNSNWECPKIKSL